MLKRNCDYFFNLADFKILIYLAYFVVDRATLYIKTHSVDVESSAIEKFFRDHQIGVIEIRRIQGKK